ncbi:MAG: 50S ribosome-binding GTPase [Candidatus Omnitrophica bacterium]|nr:50S ribosome-binding GTPase [Candidatus Omnitrophota bacterium]
MKPVRFVDEVKVCLEAGRGGEGSSARRKFKSYFVNIGGDGGDGGSIYIENDSNVFDLSKFLNKRKFQAQNGGFGLSYNKKGKNGQDLVLKVPQGTLIRDVQGGILSDLACSKEKILVVKGGRGGKGNIKRKNTLPPGPGQKKEIILDFRIPADVVLLGVTNTGKSTLISKITHLSPKISEFPFVTEKPVWGVVAKNYKMFTILELPAIIGKKNQQAPGEKFLKHLERARVLVLLIDAGHDVNEQVASLKEVLGQSNPDLRHKNTLIVLNKIDTIDGKNPDGYLGMSAKEGTGLDQFIDKVFKLLEK